MSLGPCPGRSKQSCIYVGDIGDNRRRRKSLTIVAVDETKTLAASVTPSARLTVRYPDGPHDAESMAVHRDGTLFILTKEMPARLYRGKLELPEQTLELVTTLATGDRPPTDMAIADDGTRMIVLTYQEAFELSIDFKEQRRIALTFLQQQESISYMPGGRSFIYTTERALALLIQPIMKMECRPSP